jgi:hypothetical protein
MAIVDIALEYEQSGFSVIPCKKDKKPLIPWLPYQIQRATPDEIKKWWQDYASANVGIITGEVSDLFVIDCDSEESYQTVQEYIPDSLIIPTVKTPRDGRHLYFKYPVGSNLTIKAGVIKNLDFRGNGGYVVAAPSTNGNGKSYEWIIRATRENIPEIPEKLLEFLKNSSSLNNPCNSINENIKHMSQKKQISPNVTNRDIWENGVRDENLFHVANCLIKTGNDEDYVTQTLTAIMYSWGEKDEKWINAKVQSALNRKNLKERNLKDEIEGWISVTEGDFTVTECDKELEIVTKRDKDNRRQIFHRLLNTVIERVHGKNVMYRRKNVDCEDLDFLNADTTPFDIRFPLGVHELVNIYKKSLVVIAGAPNAGKTAYCLNLAKKNMERQNVTYFSSEMGAAELKIRLQKFPGDIRDWTKIKFKYRSGNFTDVIDPDGLNIIDYLEVSKDFFEIGGMMTDIFNSLREGVAVVAIQKPKGRETGIGGERTLDKARLYLTLDSNVLRIVKGKLWATDSVNPNGMNINFSLGGGANFKNQGPWSH